MSRARVSAIFSLAALGRVSMSFPLAALVAGGAPAASAADAPVRVAVTFVAPERFTDVKDADPGSKKGTQSILDELARFLRETGERYLPPDRSLEIRVTDVDLAGEFELWRGPQFSGTRFMRELYAPRIDLEFRLTDAGGRVVAEGRRSLRDSNYLMRSQRLTDDRLRYEKDLLREWLRRELER
jgi:hypothetical protein